jgi:UDP-2,3-diacylglucosamine pyrophosphatase LpxH
MSGFEPQRFDQLFSVSDLHLGGASGFQIFHQTQLLTALIEKIRLTDPRQRVALSLNGDIVDFLAEEPRDPEHRFFDPRRALTWIDRIQHAPEFAPVWQALAALVRSPRRHLILVLGNHDLELALPSVRAAVLDYLCGNDESARGRVTMATDFSGWRCSVQGAQVLCLHGNEVDPTNVIRPEQLLAQCRAVNRGKESDPYLPTAGTRLVIEIMNPIKREYPWIDLLKPIGTAAIPIILALQPGLLSEVRKLFPVALRSINDSRHLLGLPAAPPEEIDERQAAGELERLLSPLFSDAQEETPRHEQAARLLAEAKRQLEAGRDGLDLLQEEDTILGWGDPFHWLAARLRRGGKELLRRALRAWNSSAPSAATLHPDDQFRALDQRVGAEVDFVIAGHTHRTKALQRRHPRTYYLNTGSWISRIELRPEWIEDADAFEQLWRILAASGRSFRELQAAEILGQPLITHHPSVVQISRGRDAIDRNGDRISVDEERICGLLYRLTHSPPERGPDAAVLQFELQADPLYLREGTA